MKRIISICLTVILILGFVACSGEQASLETASVLSNDLSSPMFSLDGVIYTLPVHFSELEANGWRPYDPNNRFATDILEPDDFVTWELIAGDQNVGVTFTNLSEEVLPISESYITVVSVFFEMHSAQLVLPGNIMLGSTYEDVIAAYGEPSSWHTSEDPPSLLMFHSSDDVTLQIVINTEGNLVTIMSMHYWDS